MVVLASPSQFQTCIRSIRTRNKISIQAHTIIYNIEEPKNGRPKYRFEQCGGEIHTSYLQSLMCMIILRYTLRKINYQRNRPNTDMCSYILEPKPQKKKVVAPLPFAQGTMKEHFFP